MTEEDKIRKEFKYDEKVWYVNDFGDLTYLKYLGCFDHYICGHHYEWIDINRIRVFKTEEEALKEKR